jgi:hypothetical protein
MLSRIGFILALLGLAAHADSPQDSSLDGMKFLKGLFRAGTFKI